MVATENLGFTSVNGDQAHMVPPSGSLTPADHPLPEPETLKPPDPIDTLVSQLKILNATIDKIRPSSQESK